MAAEQPLYVVEQSLTEALGGVQRNFIDNGAVLEQREAAECGRRIDRQDPHQGTSR
jgi:hypothetical protein